MLFTTYLNEQLYRYENGQESDAVYRMASHLEGHVQVLPVGRLAEYDQGCDFAQAEKEEVVSACKTILTNVKDEPDEITILSQWLDSLPDDENPEA